MRVILRTSDYLARGGRLFHEAGRRPLLHPSMRPLAGVGHLGLLDRGLRLRPDTPGRRLVDFLLQEEGQRRWHGGNGGQLANLGLGGRDRGA